MMWGAAGREPMRKADLKPWGGWRPWPVTWWDFLCKYVRTKRTMRTKCPRTGFRRGGSVRLKRLMRHKPPFRVERGWDDCFASIHDGLPPRPGRSPVILWCQVVKELRIIRGRLGALLLIAQSSAHFAARRWAWGYRVESVVNQFCLTTNSLRGPRNDAAVGAQGALGTRAFCKPVAAARNPRFGAEPGSAFAVKRRRNMNCYFHSSTVFRMRRGTLRVFLQLGRAPSLGGIKDGAFRRPMCPLASELSGRVGIACRLLAREVNALSQGNFRFPLSSPIMGCPRSLCPMCQFCPRNYQGYASSGPLFLGVSH
jgi:hypothetical protein